LSAPSPLPTAALDRARTLLAGAARTVVLTGAGVSAESGVPTFRGPEGLWRKYRPEELATPEAFRRDPRLVWEWYAWRQERVRACVPNAGHYALAKLVRSGFARLVTQNVDGLHERAAQETAGGSARRSEESPLELHGSLFRVKCTRCDWRAPLDTAVEASSAETLPRCACGALLRPAVVWFGEALDAAVIAEAFELAEAADVCLVVGTSALVQPAASLPLATLRTGGAVIEVNPEPTPLTRLSSVALSGPSAVILPELLAAPWPGRRPGEATARPA
jgi:NAD-dependent deacetylase